MHKQILESLNWRYATKQYDSSRVVAPNDLETLLEVMRLAPSSAGIQPWKFLIVTDPQVRQELRAAGYGQPQFTDASHLIIFCRRTDLDSGIVTQLVQKTAEVRKQKVAELDGLRELAAGTISSKEGQQLDSWAARQVYIPLGMLLESAALLRIDASPMEGFDPAAFDKILKLKEKNLASVVVCALGYRSADDKYSAAKKVRFAQEDVFISV